MLSIQVRAFCNPIPAALAALAAAVIAGAAGPAGAAVITDPPNDFLPSFADTHDTDLDVLSASAALMGDDVVLTATMDGAIGGTANALYVWGVNRGAGVAGFGPLAPGVFFDAVVVLNLSPGGTAVSLNGPGGGALASGSVTISGSTIKAIVPLNLLPSTGFAVDDYRYNIWPRAPGMGNSHIADFAPDNSSFLASIPEPATWAMLIAGFGLVGVSARRRRSVAAA